MTECEKYYLIHHGVKGQKWGVRRYENRDGSLTPAGKKRYDDKSGTQKKRKPMTTKQRKEMAVLRTTGFINAGVGTLMKAGGAALEITRGESFVTEVMKGAGTGMQLSGLVMGIVHAGKLHVDNKLRAASGRN